MAYATVPIGKYYGQTKEQLQAKLTSLQEMAANAVPGQGAISSASVNGTSFSYDFSAGEAGTIESEIAEVLAALQWVDDEALRYIRVQQGTCR